MSSPLWYKDAIIYQAHVKAFADSNGDGIGDFGGLIGKLDYLQSLGITAIWILPFYPSPLRDDGYDIADYYGVNPQLRHAGRFQGVPEGSPRARAAGHHGVRHQPFQRPESPGSNAPAAPKPGSPERDFYVWSDTPDKYQDARIIFKDFEPSNWSWDPVANAYYWHRFFPSPAGPELRQPGRQGRRFSRCSTSGWRWAWTGCGWTRSRTSSSARARTAKTCPRPTPS